MPLLISSPFPLRYVKSFYLRHNIALQYLQSMSLDDLCHDTVPDAAHVAMVPTGLRQVLVAGRRRDDLPDRSPMDTTQCQVSEE
jgi:hypothetical protein